VFFLFRQYSECLKPFMKYPVLQHFVSQVKNIDMCVYATIKRLFFRISATIPTRHNYAFIKMILKPIDFKVFRLYRFEQFKFKSDSAGGIGRPNQVIESRVAVDISLEHFFP